ncbi:hypothetical protein QBC43DRAFT_106164 [Cladorrhinum sp. PSN259]|nr:hypothetical protein QBC43DRAFT_106164 [Cladorrhinum sp. PSN259]
MVSFFGLKFKDKKKKTENKPETKEPQLPKRIDQNTLGEGQFFGLNPKTTGVINGSIRSVSRAGTPQPGRSPYATADTHNLAAASMFDLGNVPPVRSGTPSSLHLRTNASELNLRTRFGENNGSVASLALPAPGFVSRPVSRPGTPSGKSKPWVNPLDVHFMRATSTPPPGQQSMRLPPISTADPGTGELDLAKEAESIADAVINSVNREEAEKQKETAALEPERLERQRSAETILAPRPASPGQPQTQPPTRSQPELELKSEPPKPQGPVFRGNVDQRPDSRNGMRGNGPSPVHQGPPPTGPPTQSLPQPPGQGPSRQGPHPPASDSSNGRPEGPSMCTRPNGPVGQAHQNTRHQDPQDLNAPRGRPGPGPYGSHGPHGPQGPHPHGPYSRGPSQGPPRHGSPGPPRHGSPSQRPPYGPPQGPPRHGSPSQRHGPHGPPHSQGHRGPPHQSPYGPLSQGPPHARGPHLRGPLPPGGGPQNTGPFPQGPFRGPGLRGPGPYGPRSESPAQRPPGSMGHPLQTSGTSRNGPQPQRPDAPPMQPHAFPDDAPETPATEQAPPKPLISSLTSPTASTPTSTARSSMTDDFMNPLAPKAVIRDVAAKRDTLPALNVPGHHSLSMKIEELEQSLLAQQAAKVEEMPPPQSPEDERRTSSTSSYYSAGAEDDEENEKPMLSIHPAPLRIPSPMGVTIAELVPEPQNPLRTTNVSRVRNDSQTSPTSPHSNTPQLGHQDWKLEPSHPTPALTPNTSRPNPVIDTGFNFDFGAGLSTPLTPDSSNWPLSSPTSETAPAAGLPQSEQQEEAKFSRPNVPPRLDLTFNFSPDASSRDQTLPKASLLTPPLRSALPTLALNDGRPSTSSGFTSSGLAASPSLISRFPELLSPNDDDAASFMGIGMARGPSIREVKRPGTSTGHDNNNHKVDSFGTGFI